MASSVLGQGRCCEIEKVSRWPRAVGVTNKFSDVAFIRSFFLVQKKKAQSVRRGCVISIVPSACGTWLPSSTRGKRPQTHRFTGLLALVIGVPRRNFIEYLKNVGLTGLIGRHDAVRRQSGDYATLHLRTPRRCRDDRGAARFQQRVVGGALRASLWRIQIRSAISLKSISPKRSEVRPEVSLHLQDAIALIGWCGWEFRPVNFPSLPATRPAACAMPRAAWT